MTAAQTVALSDRATALLALLHRRVRISATDRNLAAMRELVAAGHMKPFKTPHIVTVTSEKEPFEVVFTLEFD